MNAMKSFLLLFVVLSLALSVDAGAKGGKGAAKKAKAKAKAKPAAKAEAKKADAAPPVPKVHNDATPKKLADDTHAQKMEKIAQCLIKEPITMKQTDADQYDFEKLSKLVNDHVLVSGAQRCKVIVHEVRLMEGEDLAGLLDGGKFQKGGYEAKVKVELEARDYSEIKQGDGLEGASEVTVFRRLKIKFIIFDENECTTTDPLNKHKCGADMECVNTEGSYECKCKFEGKGYSISRTFAQTKDTNTAWHSDIRKQTNSEKSQLTCVDIDECADGTNDCDSHTTNCVNVPSKTGPAGWTAPGFACECKDKVHYVPEEGANPKKCVTDLNTHMHKCCNVAADGTVSAKKCDASKKKNLLECENKVQCSAIHKPYDADAIKAILFGTNGPLPGGNFEAWSDAAEDVCFSGQKCAIGYEWNTKTNECEDVDECSAKCDDLEDDMTGIPLAWAAKDVDAFKKNNNKQYGAGWTLSGNKCNDCDSKAACKNTPGSFQCECGSILNKTTGTVVVMDTDFQSNMTVKGIVDGWRDAKAPPSKFDMAGHTEFGCRDLSLPKIVPMCSQHPSRKSYEEAEDNVRVQCITLLTDKAGTPCCGAGSASATSCDKFQMPLIDTVTKDAALLSAREADKDGTKGRGTPLPQDCTIKIPQYSVLNIPTFKIHEMTSDKVGAAKEWAEGQYFAQCRTTFPGYKLRSPTFGTKLPVTMDLNKKTKKSDMPLSMDVCINNDPRMEQRVPFEIVDHDECAADVSVKGVKGSLANWGQGSCALHAVCTNLDGAAAPYKCTCVEGWNKAGSAAYNFTVAGEANLGLFDQTWGFPNMYPLGYDAKTNGQGCIDSMPPTVECDAGPALREVVKVGCDCDDKHLSTPKQWAARLKLYLDSDIAPDMKKLCKVMDNDDQGKVVQVTDATLKIESGVQVDVKCDARRVDQQCWAHITVGATDKNGNKAEPAALKWEFSVRDSMQMMEVRLNERMDSLAASQLGKTEEVKVAVDSTNEQIGELTGCTTDLCRILKLFKFDWVVWLFLFVLVLNGVHTQIIRAALVAGNLGSIYYPHEEEKFQAGADLYLKVTRFGFMDQQERVNKATNWWQELTDEHDKEE